MSTMIFYNVNVLETNHKQFVIRLTKRDSRVIKQNNYYCYGNKDNKMHFEEDNTAVLCYSLVN